MGAERGESAGATPVGSVRTRRVERAACLALVVGCLALYAFGARQLADTGVYEYNDVLFRADTRRAHIDLSGPSDQVGRRSSTHPAFVLLHHPFGRGLTNALAAAGVPRPTARRVASTTLTAGAGAAAAALALSLLRASGVRALYALPFAGILAASTAHWIFASVPETFIFSALGLTALLLAAVRHPRSEWRFQLAAVYAVAVLVSNAAAVGAIAVLRHALGAGAEAPAVRRVLLRAAGSTALALAAVAALAALQYAVYPEAAAPRPSQMTLETRWAKWERWFETPGKTAKILARHFAIDSMLAPAAALGSNDGRPMATIEEAPREAYRSRAGALALWALVVATALAGATRAFRRPPVVAALVCIAFNALLHSVYGNDRILYACNWTVFVVLVVACSFDAASARLPRLERSAAVLLLAFLAAQLHANGRLFGEIRAAVAGLVDAP